MATAKGSYTESEIAVLNEVYSKGLRSKRTHKHLLDETQKKTGLEADRIMVSFSRLIEELIGVNIDSTITV